MKHVKKFTSLLLALAMIFTLAVTASAAGDTYTITAPNNGHTYEIYQIFTGDLHEGVLSNVKWGLNGKGTQGEAVDNTILEELENTTGTDLEKLAVITKYVVLTSAPYNTVTGSKPLSNVPAGYYLIKDVDASLAGKDDVYTTYIVEVVGNVEITPKADKPSSVKKVKDVNDSTGIESNWQDSADYDIGDEVPFLLKGIVASNYDAYKVYKFTFHDKESEGLTFNASSVKVYVDGTLITSGYEVVANPADGDSFDVVFSDLKQISAVKAGSSITVEYTSTLNTSANFGSTGNPNTMHLEYSNNPNDTQGTETGKTPDDKVIVFTYKIVVNKVDEKGQALAGAEFILQKKLPDGTWTDITAVKNSAGTVFTFTGLDDGDYRLHESATPSGFNTIADIYFRITATHDELSDNPALTALSASQTGTDGMVLEEGIAAVFSASLTDGSLSTDVENKAGSTLPETGGMGTTLFYVLGGILILAAVVLLVTKKRMSAKG